MTTRTLTARKLPATRAIGRNGLRIRSRGFGSVLISCVGISLISCFCSSIPLSIDILPQLACDETREHFAPCCLRVEDDLVIISLLRYKPGNIVLFGFCYCNLQAE